MKAGCAKKISAKHRSFCAQLQGGQVNGDRLLHSTARAGLLLLVGGAPGCLRAASGTTRERNGGMAGD